MRLRASKQQGDPSISKAMQQYASDRGYSIREISNETNREELQQAENGAPVVSDDSKNTETTDIRWNNAAKSSQHKTPT